MNYVLLLLSTCSASAKAILCKKIGHDTKNVSEVLFLNANIFAVASLTILTCSVKQVKSFFEISAFSFLLSLLFACLLLFTQITQVFAMSRGFASLSSLIYACGFLLPIFFSALFLGERISGYQLLGILLLLLALVIILPPDRNGKFSFLWLTFALLSMLGSGMNAVVQKIHQSSDYRHEITPFLFYALLFASLLSLLASRLTKTTDSVPRTSLYTKKRTGLLMVLGGIVVGGMNVSNLMLAGKLPAAIHFPVYNICSMILTALAGKLLFGESIGLRKLLGFVLGLGAITIIGLL